MRALARLGWLDPTPSSLLAPAAEVALTDVQAAQALSELRQGGFLLPDDEGLLPEFDEGLQLVADPVLRIRMTHTGREGVAKSLVVESDLVKAVLVGGDTEQVWFSTAFDAEQIHQQLVDSVCGPDPVVMATAWEVVGLEALVLGWALPLAERHELTAVGFAAALSSCGAQVSVTNAEAALAALTARGWLIRCGAAFSINPQSRHLATVPDGTTEIQVTRHGLADPATLTLRWWRQQQQVWQVAPFLVEPDELPQDEGPELLVWYALLGLEFLPRSRAQVHDAIGSLLQVGAPASV